MEANMWSMAEPFMPGRSAARPAWPSTSRPSAARPSAARPSQGLAYRTVRLVLAAVTVAALLAMLVDRRSSQAPPLAGPEAVTVPVAHRYHVVMPGDTLWSIAAGLDASADPRPLVDALVAARGTSILRVGERIALPPA